MVRVRPQKVLAVDFLGEESQVGWTATSPGSKPLGDLSGGVAGDLEDERRQIGRIETSPGSKPLGEERDDRDDLRSRKAVPKLFEGVRVRSLCLLALLVPTLSLFGGESPPLPRVLGIEFDASPHQLGPHLSRMGLLLEREPARDSKELIKSFTYLRLPDGLDLEGRTRLDFFRGRLFRLSFEIEPSYFNFNRVRGQLLGSLGERFHLVAQHEVVDDLLRTHLELLGAGQVNERTELIVRQSIERGTTYYAYELEDRKGELAVSLTFRSQPDVYDKPVVKLILNYTFIEGEQRLQQVSGEKFASILPP